MVYQDYELVATKRVGYSRARGGLLIKRQFEAFGGFWTLYMMTFAGMAGSKFGLVSSVPLVRPLASRAGVASLARCSMLNGGPVFAGMIIGMSVFGDASEFRNLLRNARTYSREFKAVQNEHYN